MKDSYTAAQNRGIVPTDEGYAKIRAIQNEMHVSKFPFATNTGEYFYVATIQFQILITCSLNYQYAYCTCQKICEKKFFCLQKFQNFIFTIY